MGKKGSDTKPDAPRQVVNRKARHDYVLEDTYEAGIALAGSEVKSIFLGRVNMTDAYCIVSANEMFLFNLDIEPYEKAVHFQPQRRRERKLLLHRKEIDTIQRRSQEKGFTIIPTRLYFKNGKVKVEVALAKGRKAYDKRDKIAADESRREAQNARKLR